MLPLGWSPSALMWGSLRKKTRKWWLTVLSQPGMRWLLPYKFHLWALGGNAFKRRSRQHSLISVTLCLEAGSASSAPPFSSYSIGQVHTSTPVTYLDELSTLKRHLASGWESQHPADAEGKRQKLNGSSTNMFLFSCSPFTKLDKKKPTNTHKHLAGSGSNQ